jgi:UDP-N-acetylglucosamine 2-epimerase
MACPKAIMVGNSSAAIREGAFLATRAVNVTSRQSGRERAENIHEANEHLFGTASIAISDAIRRWREDEIKLGGVRHYNGVAPSTLYGDGHAGEKIARLLAR